MATHNETTNNSTITDSAPMKSDFPTQMVAMSAVISPMRDIVARDTTTNELRRVKIDARMRLIDLCESLAEHNCVLIGMFGRNGSYYNVTITHSKE